MNEVVREDIESIIASDCVDWNTFKNKTVLITGASGMLPSYMALTLLTLNRINNLNIKLVALVRNQEKARQVFKDYLSDPHLEFIIQDVSIPIVYDNNIDFIIHAASQASPKYYGIDPVGTLNANILGTHNMLELAKIKKVECFLFFSTSGVYGNFSKDDIIISEEMYGMVDPLNVRSCYFESKRMAENMCVCYAYQYGIPAKIIRIFHTLGPYMDINDGRAFSDFCKAIVENKNIVLRSDGTAYRTFCYVSDAVRAYFMVLLNGKSAEAYNIGGSSNNETTMKDLAYLLINSYSEKGLSVEFDIDKDDVTYNKMRSSINRIIPDISKIESLGWKENFTTQQAFMRTISSIQLSEYYN